MPLAHRSTVDRVSRFYPPAVPTSTAVHAFEEKHITPLELETKAWNVNPGEFGFFSVKNIQARRSVCKAQHVVSGMMPRCLK